VVMQEHAFVQARLQGIERLAQGRVAAATRSQPEGHSQT
jgi:hypothetical protein